ncbi:hypothetical protein HKD37_09G025170 [Glycine soja]
MKKKNKRFSIRPSPRVRLARKQALVQSKQSALSAKIVHALSEQCVLSASTKAQIHSNNYKKRVKPSRKDTPSLRALSYIPKA